MFGSYVGGEQPPDSDVALLVCLGPGLMLIDLAGLELGLGESLGLSASLRPQTISLTNAKIGYISYEGVFDPEARTRAA